MLNNTHIHTHHTQHNLVIIYLLTWNFSSFLPEASKPVLEQSPKNVTVLDGKDAVIVCRALGAPIPNVTWVYNGKFLLLKKSLVWMLAFFFSCNKFPLTILIAFYFGVNQ